jgi:zinc transporter ZupT
MLAAAAGLAANGWSGSPLRTAIGVVAGIIALGAARRRIARHNHVHVGRLRETDAAHAALVILALTVNSFAEGFGVGVSFGHGNKLGVFATSAIALLNVAQGLAIALVLVPRGERVRSAVGWSLFSSVPQPLIAVPAFLFVDAFSWLLPAGLGFAAGAVAWMVAAELVPDARADAPRREVTFVVALSFAAMLGIEWLLLHI